MSSNELMKIWGPLPKMVKVKCVKLRVKCVKLCGTVQNEILGQIMWDGESTLKGTLDHIPWIIKFLFFNFVKFEKLMTLGIRIKLNR